MIHKQIEEIEQMVDSITEACNELFEDVINNIKPILDGIEKALTEDEYKTFLMIAKHDVPLALKFVETVLKRKNN